MKGLSSPRPKPERQTALSKLVPTVLICCGNISFIRNRNGCALGQRGRVLCGWRMAKPCKMTGCLLAGITTWFPRFLRAHDLPAVTVHSLRHTYASLMIASHVPIVTVAGRLGHAQTSTTTDIYAGFIKTADAAASDVMEGVFDRIKEKSHA